MARTKATALKTASIPRVNHRAQARSKVASMTLRVVTLENRTSHLNCDGENDAPHDALSLMEDISFEISKGRNGEGPVLIRCTEDREERRSFDESFWQQMFTICYALRLDMTRLKLALFHKQRIYKKTPVPKLISGFLGGLLNLVWFRYSAIVQVWRTLANTPVDPKPLNEAFVRYIYDLDLPSREELKEFIDKSNKCVTFKRNSWYLESETLVEKAATLLNSGNPWGADHATCIPVEQPSFKQVSKELRKNIARLSKVGGKWTENWQDDTLGQHIKFPPVIRLEEGEERGQQGNNDEDESVSHKLGPYLTALNKEYPNWMKQFNRVQNANTTPLLPIPAWLDSGEPPSNLTQKTPFRVKVDELIGFAKKPNINRKDFETITFTLVKLRHLASNGMASPGYEIGDDDVTWLDDSMNSAF